LSWRSSGGARPEGIATPESSLQVQVLPGVLKLAVKWRSEARRDRDAGKQPAGSSPAGRTCERSTPLTCRLVSVKRKRYGVLNGA
jgi:hypothetical protein